MRPKIRCDGQNPKFFGTKRALIFSLEELESQGTETHPKQDSVCVGGRGEVRGMCVGVGL